MFRRLSNDLPKEPSYPADLAALGFTLTPEGLFVKASEPQTNPPSFFQFFNTDNERANEMHKEAMHECAREAVISQLGKLGVKPLYINGKGYDGVKPAGPHVTMLTTELEALKGNKDVVVVVGEGMQDLGIWAYRILMRGGGIDEGSAVGLAKKLQHSARGDTRQDSITGVAGLGKTLKNLILGDSGATHSPSEDQHEDAPGLIILNPGQLLYSHKLNKNMSQATWLGRPKPNAIADPYPVDPVHNRVEGHKTAEEHIECVFKSIIPAITAKEVRLYLVGINESGETLLNHLDRTLQADPSAAIGANLEAVALIQPMHTPSELRSVALKTVLAARGRSWVMSSGRPKGELLVVPNASGLPISHYTDQMTLDEIPKQIEKTEAAETKSGEGNEEPVSPSTTTAPIAIPARSRANIASHESDVSAGSGGAAVAGVSKGTGTSYSFPKSPSAIQRSVASLQSNPGSLMEKSVSTLSKSNPNLADSVASLAPNPYALDGVSCPTFSSGVDDGIVELIWPAVMDDVLKWFAGLAEEARERVKGKE